MLRVAPADLTIMISIDHRVHGRFRDVPTGRRRHGRSAGVRTVVAAVVALVAASLTIAAVDGRVSASTTWHVAPWGSDSADGTVDDPLRSVVAAVDRAADGDSVELRGGVYREEVLVAGKAVHIGTHRGERAVFDGSVVVDGWARDGDAWVRDGWVRQFRRERTGGPVPEANHLAGYPDQVFVGDVALHQVLSVDDVAPGTFFHDTEADRLWIGDDPADSQVRASVLQWAFYFDEADGSSLTDVTVTRYATERSDMSAVRAYSDDLVFDRVNVESNARIGFSARGRDIVVRYSRFVDNGYIGLHADEADTLVVERSAILGNNRAGFDPFHAASGMKVTTSTGVTVRDSDVSHNGGPGIWTDLDTESVSLVGNFVEGNARAGIEIELSERVVVVGNIVVGNGEAGVWILESRGVTVSNNATARNVNEIEVEEGPRREVADVEITNNLVTRPAAGSRAALVVGDWTAERSGRDMGVTESSNLFWIPDGSGTDAVSRWARWPDQVAVSVDLDQHRDATGQGEGSLLSRSVAEPFVGAAGAPGSRSVGVRPLGDPVSGAVARELGIDDGVRPPIGPLDFVRRR